jgi:type 1 glutamine amidotransferase
MTDTTDCEAPMTRSTKSTRSTRVRTPAVVFFAGVAALTLPLLGNHQTAPQTAPRQVLYLTQSAAFAHDVLDHSEAVLGRIATESGLFDVSVSHDASTLTADTLARYAAVVFYTTGELPMGDEGKAALLDYVRGGGGFVGVHSATDTFYEWPDYLALIGGYFDGHPWRQEVTVRVENQTHPSTRHLGASFRIDDEIYQFRQWSRAAVDVLLSLDVGSVDLAASGINRRDQDFALAWTRREGAGRVFYTALGHRPEVWDDARFQRHLLEGIRWAMGHG